MKKVLGLLKNIALVLVVLVVIGMFVGGGSDDETSGSSVEQEATEQAATEQEATEQEASSEEAADGAEDQSAEETDDGPTIATNSEYAVTINNFEIVDDYDGAPCIAIDYTFTNVSDDDATSMSLATSITVYQNGVECEDAYFAEDNSDGYTNKVKAGTSVDVRRVYRLQDTTSDVEVEVAPLFSWGDDLLAYQVFKLS